MLKKITRRTLCTPAGKELQITAINPDNETVSVISNNQVREIKYSTIAVYTDKETGVRANKTTLNSWLNGWEEPELPTISGLQRTILLTATIYRPFLDIETKEPGKGRASLTAFVNSYSKKEGIRDKVSQTMYELSELGLIEADENYILTPLGRRMLTTLEAKGQNEPDNSLITPKEPDTKPALRPQPAKKVKEVKVKEEKKIPTPKEPTSRPVDPDNPNLVYIPDLELELGIEARKLRRLLRALNLNSGKAAHTWVWDKTTPEYQELLETLRKKVK